jgi:hypothetical protein
VPPSPRFSPNSNSTARSAARREASCPAPGRPGPAARDTAGAARRPRHRGHGKAAAARRSRRDRHGAAPTPPRRGVRPAPAKRARRPRAPPHSADTGRMRPLRQRHPWREDGSH